MAPPHAESGAVADAPADELSCRRAATHPLFVGAAGMALTCLYLALAEFWHAAGGAAPRPILEEPPPDPEPEIRFGREGAGP